jgi:hypothetical protein
MAITITLTIPDEFEGPLNTFLTSHVVNKAHPVTGANILEPVFPTADDWADSVLRDALANIVRMYPSAALLAKLEQQRTVQEEITELSKPGSLKPKKEKK